MIASSIFQNCCLFYVSYSLFYVRAYLQTLLNTIEEFCLFYVRAYLQTLLNTIEEFYTKVRKTQIGWARTGHHLLVNLLLAAIFLLIGGRSPEFLLFEPYQLLLSSNLHANVLIVHALEFLFFLLVAQFTPFSVLCPICLYLTCFTELSRTSVLLAASCLPILRFHYHINRVLVSQSCERVELKHKG